MRICLFILIFAVMFVIPSGIMAKDITGTYVNEEGSITIQKTEKKDIFRVIIKDKNGICQQRDCTYWKSLNSLGPTTAKGESTDFDIFFNTDNITIRSSLHPFDDPCQWSKENLFFTKK